MFKNISSNMDTHDACVSFSHVIMKTLLKWIFHKEYLWSYILYKQYKSVSS